MRRIYQLMLEKWAKDLGLSTAVGVTAGMQAALGDADKSLEERVDAELHRLLGSLEQGPRMIEATDATQQLPPKRGPGRPRKNHEENGGASNV